MKILILGAGGTGGYFGGRLAEAGADVTFLVREKRAAQLAAHGLMIETLTESIRIPVKTITAADEGYDLIILSCKAYDLASSIAAITPAISANTKIIPLLNGMSHMTMLDEKFGLARVMGGSCQIAATLTGEGVVKNLADTHSIVWGARDAGQNDIANELATWFAKTPVQWRVSDNIMQDMWEKLVFLATLAGMTSLMRASVGDILATNDGQRVMRRYLDSSIAIAIKEGYTPRPEIMARFDAVITSTGSALKASMLRDIEAGNDVEADHIVGYMLDKAREYGVDDAMLSVAYVHLQAYQRGGHDRNFSVGR
jgi:2-dehydropantoate 2-reductase